MKRPNRSGRLAGDAMTYAERIGIYHRQNGHPGVTPRQRRRLNKKANAGRAGG